MAGKSGVSVSREALKVPAGAVRPCKADPTRAARPGELPLWRCARGREDTCPFSAAQASKDCPQHCPLHADIPTRAQHKSVL